MSRLIYLDNAATTQVYPEVVDAMLPYFTEHYGNPSAIYSFADEAERAVDHARGEVADLIGAKKDEIYFTGGGSESDNWALKATAEAYAAKGKHIITSAIEHHAILHTAQWLEKHGFEVTYVGVDEDGKIKLDELKAAIRPDIRPETKVVGNSFGILYSCHALTRFYKWFKGYLLDRKSTRLNSSHT